MTPRRFFQYAANLGFPKRVAVTALVLFLSGFLFEGAGITMLLPAFQYIQSGGDIAALTAESQLWRRLVEAYAVFGVQVNLAALLVTSFLCILARQGFVYLRLIYMARAQENLVRDIRNSAFREHLLAGTSYQDRQHLGEVVNDLTTELQRAVTSLFSSVVLAGYALLTLGYLCILFALSWSMTLAALGVILVSVGLIHGLLARTEETGRAMTEANQRMSTFLVERLRSTRLIRLSGTEEAETNAMSMLTLRQRDNLINLARLLARIDVVIEPVVIAFGFALLYVGVISFDLDLGEIGLFLVIVLRLLPVMKETMRTRQTILGAAGGLDAVNRRLEKLRANRDRLGGTLPFEGLKKELRVEAVRFDYGQGSPVPALDGIDLTIPAGKMTALVGPSGGGKSTLVDMLPRLREPDSGRILIDDRHLAEFSSESLRAGIAYAPQVPQIFNVTAAEHIRYGRRNATMDEVREAARLAGADDFIRNMPQGYKTQLGEGGATLSGGQRQRLDLARALVKNAHLLVLDEPTSNLDGEAESLFRQALARIRAETDTTIVIIGHRLSTVADADKIALLDGGRIIATGTHADLLKGSKWYAQAWATQTQEPRTADLTLSEALSTA